MIDELEKQSCTKVLFDDDAKQALLEGAAVVANAVGITLGPKGKTVLIQQRDKFPILTKDGVTVSKAISLKDPIKRMGGDLLRDVAQRTNELAGDGTTTSTVVAYAMMKEGYKLLTSGYELSSLLRGIELAKDFVVSELRECAKQVLTYEETRNIATISANNDQTIGTIIADAINAVGRDGIVTVEDAKGMQTTLEIVEGTQYNDRGYVSPYFVNNNERMLCVYDDCRILITDKKISTLNEILPALEFIHRNCQSLLIIADGIEGEALQGLVVNRTKSNLRVVAINAPGISAVKGEMLEDIAILTGGQVISSKKGTSFSDAEKCLGVMKRVIVGAKSTTFIGNGKRSVEIEKRLSELRTQSIEPGLSQDELSLLKIRIARLAGGVAIIRVGGLTETEIIEKRYRVEDALNATRAAIEEGYIPGGGITLYRIAKQLQNDVLNDSTGGVKVFLAGCLAPLKQICKNANKSYEVVFSLLDNVSDNTTAYDAKYDKICNVIECGIIDPVKVARCAIEHASSITTAFLSLDAAVVEEEK